MIRAVPYYGEAKSREVIRKHELYHDHTKPGTTGLKFNVLVTTYETVTNPKEFGLVFNSVPRWETLVVDEGQRRGYCNTICPPRLIFYIVKSDSSLIFKKLKDLNTKHRIILTGVRCISLLV